MTKPSTRLRRLLPLLNAATLATAALCVAPLLSIAAGDAPRRAADSWEASPGVFGNSFSCEQRPWLCADSVVPYEGRYIGQDEPAILFYSATPGSGNSATYTVVLPSEPSIRPTQDGSGGTYDFQLFPAFWFGMAMCDTQSYPEFSSACTPDSDTNIFDGPSAAAPDYVGHHTGTAITELQFYPPGWVASCDGTHWCSALTIDSVSFDPNRRRNNNKNCLKKVGIEPLNIAFITTSGAADSAADPLNFNKFLQTNLADLLLMNSGDSLTVQMNDTPDGLHVAINDTTTGKSGSMTASIANGFAQVVFDPKARKCSSIPYAFHPMYATSGPHTRVPWSAHSFNVGFAVELGHFEYCNKVVHEGGRCAAAGASDHLHKDRDDNLCFGPAISPNVAIGGCVAQDTDFDSVSYTLAWPGSIGNSMTDSELHPSSVMLASPRFQPSAPGLTVQNYDQVAFESNLPGFESGIGSGCNLATGRDCVIPPPKAAFYPFFSIGSAGGTACFWQFGAGNIPGTTDTFGGSSAAEFGNLVELAYPATDKEHRPLSVQVFEDFQNVLGNNPCPAPPP